MSDVELAERFQKGDREAFEKVVLEYQAAVYGFVRARVLQAPDADDVTQEVFLRSFAARKTFATGGKFRPWLLGIARNVLKERARRLRRQKESAWTDVCLELDEFVQPEDSTPDEMLTFLPGCIETLGPHARQAVDLHYAGRMRLQEIGSRLKRSEGAVKLLLFRARQALRSCLGSKCEVPGHDR